MPSSRGSSSKKSRRKSAHSSSHRKSHRSSSSRHSTPSRRSSRRTSSDEDSDTSSDCEPVRSSDESSSSENDEARMLQHEIVWAGKTTNQLLEGCTIKWASFKDIILAHAITHGYSCHSLPTTEQLYDLCVELGVPMDRGIELATACVSKVVDYVKREPNGLGPLYYHDVHAGTIHWSTTLRKAARRSHFAIADREHVNNHTAAGSLYITSTKNTISARELKDHVASFIATNSLASTKNKNGRESAKKARRAARHRRLSSRSLSTSSLRSRASTPAAYDSSSDSDCQETVDGSASGSAAAKIKRERATVGSSPSLSASIPVSTRRHKPAMTSISDSSSGCDMPSTPTPKQKGKGKHRAAHDQSAKSEMNAGVGEPSSNVAVSKVPNMAPSSSASADAVFAQIQEQIAQLQLQAAKLFPRAAGNTNSAGVEPSHETRPSSDVNVSTSTKPVVLEIAQAVVEPSPTQSVSIKKPAPAAVAQRISLETQYPAHPWSQYQNLDRVIKVLGLETLITLATQTASSPNDIESLVNNKNLHAA